MPIIAPRAAAPRSPSSTPRKPSAGLAGHPAASHYLTEASQEGLFNHVTGRVQEREEVGVIVYNRGGAR
jgi:dihydrodipicolinate synthase/N-acetylneuraminate lyase